MTFTFIRTLPNKCNIGYFESISPIEFNKYFYRFQLVFEKFKLVQSFAKIVWTFILHFINLTRVGIFNETLELSTAFCFWLLWTFYDFYDWNLIFKISKAKCFVSMIQILIIIKPLWKCYLIIFRFDILLLLKCGDILNFPCNKLFSVI